MTSLQSILPGVATTSSVGAVSSLLKAARESEAAAVADYREAVAWEVEHPGEDAPAEIVSKLQLGMAHFDLSVEDVARDVADLRAYRESAAKVGELDAAMRERFDRSPAAYAAAANEQDRLGGEAERPFREKATMYRARGANLADAIRRRNAELASIPAVHPRLSGLFERPEHLDESTFGGPCKAVAGAEGIPPGRG